MKKPLHTGKTSRAGCRIRGLLLLIWLGAGLAVQALSGLQHPADRTELRFDGGPGGHTDTHQDESRKKRSVNGFWFTADCKSVMKNIIYATHRSLGRTSAGRALSR